jgi:hypothetical protein
MNNAPTPSPSAKAWLNSRKFEQVKQDIKRRDMCIVGDARMGFGIFVRIVGDTWIQLTAFNVIDDSQFVLAQLRA